MDGSPNPALPNAAQDSLDDQQTKCASWILEWHGLPPWWETHYVPEQLLAGVKLLKEVVYNQSEHATLHDCTILVMRHRQCTRELKRCSREAQVRLLRRYQQERLRFLLILLGEEQDGCDVSKLLVEASPLVLRNYFSESCEPYSQVLTVPLGVKNGKLSGVRKRHKPPSHRTLVWYFASSHTSKERFSMVSSFSRTEGLQPNFLAYPGTDPLYTDNLQNTKFALCPPGNVHDTWRMMEALDAGAIPVTSISSQTYFTRLLGHNITRHFVVYPDSFKTFDPRLPDYTVAIRQMKELLSKHEELDRVARKLHHAYDEYDMEWKATVANRVTLAGISVFV